MNIKVFVAAVALGLAALTVSCSQKETAAPVETAISVDSLFTAAPSAVGDTVLVEGFCSHLCKHGGRKAFLVGNDTTLILRCEATADMGGAFAPDCIGSTLKVRGIVRENRIGEAEVVAMEARHAAASEAEAAHQACDTEKKAQGQSGLDSFEARIADYRQKIAERTEKEGKDYLSFYYLEALKYE